MAWQWAWFPGSGSGHDQAGTQGHAPSITVARPRPPKAPLRCSHHHLAYLWSPRRCLPSVSVLLVLSLALFFSLTLDEAVHVRPSYTHVCRRSRAVTVPTRFCVLTPPARPMGSCVTRSPKDHQRVSGALRRSSDVPCSLCICRLIYVTVYRSLHGYMNIPELFLFSLIGNDGRT